MWSFKPDECGALQGPVTAIAVAWITRHPANMQPVTGTMNLQRLKECAQASEIRLTREEWYELYLAAGNDLH